MLLAISLHVSMFWLSMFLLRRGDFFTPYRGVSFVEHRFKIFHYCSCSFSFSVCLTLFSIFSVKKTSIHRGKNATTYVCGDADSLATDVGMKPLQGPWISVDVRWKWVMFFLWDHWVCGAGKLKVLRALTIPIGETWKPVKRMRAAANDGDRE